MDDRKKHGHRKRILALAWLIWVAYTLIIVIVSAPKITASIKESGVLSLITSQDTDKTTTTESRTIDACFYLIDGSCRLYLQSWRRGNATIYHDAMENLLAGPDAEALAQGATSYIADGTELIGLTRSSGILYPDVSSTFLQSTDIKKAYDQIERTLMDFPSIRGIVVLVEGKRFTF